MVAGLVLAARCAWWRDTPSVLRRPDAVAMAQAVGEELAVDVGPVLDAKVGAVTCYETQVPFQFGSAAATGPALRDLARAEGERCGAEHPAEALRAGVEAAELVRRLVGEPRPAVR